MTAESLRVHRNIGYIENRQKRTRRFVAVGIVLLAGAIITPLVNSSPNMIAISYGALILGFFAFIYGTQQYSKWRRRPRVDEVLDATLSRLSDRFALIHYPEVGRNAPEHVLVTPGGVVVLTPKDASGRISVDGNRWRQHKLIFTRFFNLGAPSLGNPTVENELQMDCLEELFDEHAIPGEIEGVIVFLPDELQLEMKDPVSTVAHISELYELIREIGSEVQLGNDDRNEIIDLLTVGTRFESSGARPSRPKKKIKVAGS
ncbi:MAG: nuclease-related domain-containing protein [Thermomicrobiales bacterium]